MRKLVYVAVVGLTMGSSLSIFAQEPEKKDTTVVNPENSLAFMQDSEKKDTVVVESPSVSFAMAQEPEKKDSTTVEKPKGEVGTSYAMAQEPEKKEQSQPSDSIKKEKTTCPDMKLA